MMAQLKRGALDKVFKWFYSW